MLKGKIRSSSDPSTLQSVVAQKEHSHLSNKYRFISTQNVMDIVKNMGWEPVQAQEKAVRKEEREGFQKHLIRFRQMGAAPVNGIFPEVVLTNSHDGSASFVFMAGLFRLICTNGLIVSEGMFGSIKVRHMNFQKGEVISAVERVVEDTPKLLDHIEIYQSIHLSREEQYKFAEEAIKMKFKKEEAVREQNNEAILQIEDRRFDMTRLLSPLRNGDAAESSSLWNTFNIIQEKFIKGGNFEDTTRVDSRYLRPQPVHVNKVRGIKGIDESIRVNKELWSLTEKTAIDKAA